MTLLDYTYRKLRSAVKDEGAAALLSRTARRLRYTARRLVQPAPPNGVSGWHALKDRFRGKRVFLVGNGPSLNMTPLYYLRNEYTMCANHFYLMFDRLNWRPSFYIVVDNLVLNDLVHDIDRVAGFSKYLFLPDIHVNGENYIRQVGERANVHWLRQAYGRGFSTRLPTIYSGGTVIGDGLQVLNYLGFESIYLVGVDMNFSHHDTSTPIRGRQTDIRSNDDDDPNHFDPRYFGKGRHYHQPTTYVVRSIVETLSYMASLQDRLSARIYNATANSKLDCFPHVDFRSLFDVSDDETALLFGECLRQAARGATIESFRRNACHVRSSADWTATIGNAYMAADLAASLVGRAILTHIPLGPFRDEYFMVRRTQVAAESGTERE